MTPKFTNAAFGLVITLIASAVSGLVYLVIGGGRSWGAYVLGGLGLLGWFALVVVAIALLGWIADRVSTWLQRF